MPASSLPGARLVPVCKPRLQGQLRTGELCIFLVRVLS